MTWLFQPLPAAQAGNGQTLTPALFTNTNSFYAPTVAATYALTASLFTNDQTFYAATVSQGGATQDLTPSLVTNSQTFYAATVAATYAIAPALFTNTQTFYAPTLAATYALTPSLLTNSQTFYGPTVSQGGTPQDLTPGLATNDNTFFAPTVSQPSTSLHGRRVRGKRVIFPEELPPEPVAMPVIEPLPSLAKARIALVEARTALKTVQNARIKAAEREERQRVINGLSAELNAAQARYDAAREAEARIVRRLRDEDELFLLAA